ncbi:DUF3967 domain-containing protein [Gottfriedia luciferensis]|uniref:DUF3967 domain-containing protein n=1 Tax=Gottfriedia luciferensis TaxID=178774 RepID=UPI00130283A8|nr:DUF3967 domain-containing protein [Gottfriedia luciferensis]
MSLIFTSKDISKKLKIGKSRVREISRELEKADYLFTKNQDTRIYTQKDFELFQLIIKDYQTSENIPNSVQFALTYLLNESLSDQKIDEPLPFDLEIKSNNTPPNLLENNLHTNFDINNENKVIEETEDSQIIINEDEQATQPEIFEKVILSQFETIEEEFVPQPDPMEEDVNSQLEGTEETIIESPIPQNIEKISENNSVIQTVNTQFENEIISNYRMNGKNVEQQSSVIRENNLINEEVIYSQSDDNNALFEEDLRDEIVPPFVPLNSNQIMFEEFMSQITSLANQNEQILHQNQTLIKQNLEKDHKLERILNSVEEKSEELHVLATVIEEKDEKLEQMFEEIQLKEAGRDAQLMRMIRELQETKRMVAASKERDWKSAIKSLFIKPKSVK